MLPMALLQLLAMGATCLPGSVLRLPRVPGFFLLRAHGVWSVEQLHQAGGALWQEQK